MEAIVHNCPNCGDLMVPAEGALNRGLMNSLLCGFGSSILQIRPDKGKWMDFMTPNRNARASYCTSCGCLLMAPSLKNHRKILGID